MSEPGFEYYPPPELPERQKPAAQPGADRSQPGMHHPEPQETFEPPEMSPARRMMIISSVLIIAVSLAFVLRATVFTIRFVRVVGLHNFSWQEVAASAGITSSSNYFGLREEKISDNINANRYLVYERMQKVFPNTVILYVKERRPVARINYIGVSYVMADDGLILGSTRQSAPDSASLMSISGLALRDIREGKLPVSTKEGQIESCIVLVKELYAQGFETEIADINLSEPASIYMTTRDGYSVHIGDTGDLKPKIGTVRAVLPKLRSMGREGGTIEATVWGEATHIPESP